MAPAYAASPKAQYPCVGLVPDGVQLAFPAEPGQHLGGELQGRPNAHPVRPKSGRSPERAPRATVSWAPASSLLFAEIGAQPEGVVRQVNPDGTGEHSVLAHATSPSWGPDATHFAAILAGRTVIGSARNGVAHPVGLPGQQVVSWAGPQ